jgi:hypothetical protein
VSRGRASGGLGDVVAVLGTFAVLGVACGVLWWLAVEPAELTNARGDGASMGELELSRRFAADGWYSVIAIVAGFLGGLVVTWWRSRDFRLTTVLLVPAAGLAAATMALVGRVLGPGDSDVALSRAERGASVPVELAVTATPSYLMWPIAVLAGALMVLWSSSGSDQPAEHAAEPAEDTPDQAPPADVERSRG